jgi:hypothetical protein
MPEYDVLVVGGSVIDLRATLAASKAPCEALRLDHVNIQFACDSEGTLALRRLKDSRISRTVPRST